MKAKKLIVACIQFITSTLIAQTFSIVVTSTTPSCDSLCTGSATLVSYTTPPISYTITGITYTTGVSSSTTIVINNLCAGSYTIFATSGTGWGTTNVNINQIPVPLITNVNYAPAIPPNPPFAFTATASISGGTPPYYVNWHDYTGTIIKSHTVTTNQDTATLYPGDYSITLTDSINAANGCPGNTSPYYFSICTSNATGFINLLPNDTVCAGSTYTVQFFPAPFGPMNIINASVYADSTANCMPMSSTNPYAVFTCTATQNTSFYGNWWYATGCPPVPYQTATLVVMNCTNVKNQNESNEIISVYPNPSDGYLKLLSNKNRTAELEITDVMGRVLITKKIDSNATEYFDLPEGIYYLKINTPNISKVIRWVIIK